MASFSNDKNMPINFAEGSAPYVGTHNVPIQKSDLPTGEQLGVNDNARNVQYNSIPQTNIESQPRNTEIHHYYVERRDPQPEVIIVERPVVIFEDPYPVLSIPMAWLILIVNIFFPGVGTIVVGCMGVENPGYFFCWGIFQLLTAFFLLGWILAIQTSIALILKAE